MYVYCREARGADDDLSARFFFESQGVREDPATGSATACLGRYLLEHDAPRSQEISLRIGQGHEIDRPSLLRLRARVRDGAPEIRVGGGVIPTAEGRLLG